MDDYLRKRRPMFVVNTQTGNDITQKVSTKSIVTETPPKGKTPCIVIAPLNTNLTGWEQMAKRC